MQPQLAKTIARPDRSTEFILEEVSVEDKKRQIAALAYEFWQARGCPEGTSEEDWFRAEQEIARSRETDLDD